MTELFAGLMACLLVAAIGFYACWVVGSDGN